MARAQSRYVCQQCGEAYLRWEGQCRNCGGWNSLVETLVREPSKTSRVARQAAGPSGGPGRGQPEALARVSDVDLPRLSVDLPELDRVLGGGLVPGSVVLVGGEPGIGKSTLLLQAAAGVARSGSVLYASGEESAAQVRLRATRLGLVDGQAGERVMVVAESSIDRIVGLAQAQRPSLLIVDSIQTATVDDLDGAAGSVGQVRESALRLMELAKGSRDGSVGSTGDPRRDAARDGAIAVVVVGHVTKDGSLAGPKTLEHLVDAVIGLEGERFASLRLLRATKNRFGSTEEVGVLEMGELGLSALGDPARAFLTEHDGSASGSHDVYANLAGGLALDEPALDLPVALALASSFRDRPVRAGTVAIGEVGLLGELRSVAGLERRLREAARLGFDRAIVPRPGRAGTIPAIEGLEVVAVATLREAVERALA